MTAFIKTTIFLSTYCAWQYISEDLIDNNWDSLEIWVRRWICKQKGQVIKVPVIRVIDINSADRHVIKQSVVRVDSDGLVSRLRRVFILTLNHKRKMSHGPLLRYAVVTDVHTQIVRLEAECRPLETTTPCNQASFISWPQIKQRITLMGWKHDWLAVQSRSPDCPRDRQYR